MYSLYTSKEYYFNHNHKQTYTHKPPRVSQTTSPEVRVLCKKVAGERFLYPEKMNMDFIFSGYRNLPLIIVVPLVTETLDLSLLLGKWDAIHRVGCYAD